MELLIAAGASALAIVAADFVSGVVHWAEDTFGEVDTPIVGRWIVAPNELHHRDAGAFTHKGWLASSWDLALASALLVAIAAWLGMLTPYLVLFALLGANANEVHKWNHAPRRAPWIARVLWRARLLQAPEEHARHHAGAKNSAYCVLTPFVNPLLDRIGFWRGFERVLVPLAGGSRRADLAHLRERSASRRASRRSCSSADRTLTRS